MASLMKLVVCLLMLMTLTTTWARSSSVHQREMVSKEETRQRENTSKINQMKNEANDEIIHTIGSDEESHENHKNHIRRYLKIEAEKLLRTNVENGGKRRRSLHDNDDKVGVSFSTRRLEKMLEKAILKIITGDLSTADMLLLKSLNYSLEEVLAIRERELGKKINSPEVSDVDERNKIFYDHKMNNDLTESERSLVEKSPENYLNDNEEKSSAMIKSKKSVTPMSSGSLSEMKIVERLDKDIDFDAYNRQAVYDYENGGNINISQQSELDPISSGFDFENRSNDNVDIDAGDDDFRKNFDRAMEPHVVFKIRYDDSEFDSGSKEKDKQLSRERIHRVILKNGIFDDDHRGEIKITTDSLTPSENELSAFVGINTTPGNKENKPFQASTIDVLSSLPVVYRLGNFITPQENLDVRKAQEPSIDTIDKDIIIEEKNASSESSKIHQTSGSSTGESDELEKNNVDSSSMQNETDDRLRGNSVYEGLEWIEDDVYRVIPEAIESLNYYDVNANDMDDETFENIDMNETRTHEIDRRIGVIDHNDTNGYQNENPEDETHSQTPGGNSSTRIPPNNLSTYQQLALAHRRDGNLTSPFDSQGQKAIEDIKLKILAMTGRFNMSSSSNQVQRERLTMFSPICHEPRNTDLEAWTDPFLMNMHFQLNLTSGDHVVAAKLRIYKLPQDNMTVTSGVAAEEEDEEEKKIRISVYFYTKSLKKHRSKKRLMDSVVSALTTEGSHLALDVRQALRFWRQNSRNTHGSNNHGLVIQVEDQEGRPLKPSQYVQQDSCHTSELNEDDKINESLHSSFKPVLVTFVS